jgi:hypothetical protein
MYLIFFFQSTLLKNLNTVLASFYYCCDKIPNRNNLREERFIFTHGFKGFSPWLLCPCHWVECQVVGACGGEGCSLYSDREAEREEGTWDQL